MDPLLEGLGVLVGGGGTRSDRSSTGCTFNEVRAQGLEPGQRGAESFDPGDPTGAVDRGLVQVHVEDRLGGQRVARWFGRDRTHLGVAR